MNIHIKSKKEQDKMRAAGKLAAQTLEMIEPHVQVGITTEELNTLVHDFTTNSGAICAPLNYHGFPKSVCISVNDVACHGIPGDYTLQDGDIVNIDVSPKLDGWHGDTSKMFLVGDVRKEDRELCEIAHGAMWAGIGAIELGRDVKTIGDAIQLFMIGKPATIAKEFCGHGIGSNFHEAPQILHYSSWATGTLMVPGLIFTIEPIINAGNGFTTTSRIDNWTVTTNDGKKSAQWEHTILITEDGYEILTLREEEK